MSRCVPWGCDSPSRLRGSCRRRLLVASLVGLCVDVRVDPSLQPTVSPWAAGSGLSAVSPPLEGVLVALLAQPELGQYDLALPFPSGHLLKMTQTPLSNHGLRWCAAPFSAWWTPKGESFSPPATPPSNICILNKTAAKYFQPFLSTQLTQTLPDGFHPRTCINAPVPAWVS